MSGRHPPPSYEATVNPDTLRSPFATTGGRTIPVGRMGRAPPHYRRPSLPSSGQTRQTESPTAESLRSSLRSNGVRVVYYPPQRGRPEERTVWADGTDFVLIFRGTLMGGRKKITYKLADLQTVTLGVPSAEFFPSGATGSMSRRIGDHVPDARSTLRLRFTRDAVVDIACFSLGETKALKEVLQRHATAQTFESTGGNIPRPGGNVPRPRPQSGLFDSNSSTVSVPGGGTYNSLPGGGRGGMDTPSRGQGRGRGRGRAVGMNGGPRRTRSNLRDMMQEQEEYHEAREAFLGPDQDGAGDPAADALRPHTLAEVSGAVPQTPACYVIRETESARLAEVLTPDPGSEIIGGATTVIFDRVANGKSVLAAAAMQDPRVQGSFPGGVIWLRAGRAAGGRLLRMMELAVCQITEEMERKGQSRVDSRVPERFGDVGAASDYLASLLVRTCSGGAREILLVLDDVWDANVVEAFETIGLSLLVTTREPLIARLATPTPSGQSRLIGPLGQLSHEEATAAAAKAASTRRIPDKESGQLLDRTGRCPLAVGVVASTLKQALGPLDWNNTHSKVRKTYTGLQKKRQGMSVEDDDDTEDRITASIAAGLSNMPEENQMLYSALCIIPPGLPVTCRLLEQVWETGKRTTILAAEAFEHRRLLDRLGPGNFVLHYEAARFLQKPPGFAGGGGAWVGCKLRGQGRELAFSRLCKHLDSFDTLRDHLTKRDLWGLTELWNTCEAEAKKTSGHSHVSCRIYESRLDLLRQEADIVAGPGSHSRQSTAKIACEATLDLAQALDMVADFQAYNNCCDPAPLYRESIESLRQSLDLAAMQGSSARGLESRVKRALERITGKLGAILLKQGKPREALQSCAESLTLTRERQGTEDYIGGTSGRAHPHQDVIDAMYSMAQALMESRNVEEARDLYEEAAILLRRLYGEEASRCLEARGLEQLASMVAQVGKLDMAEALNDQCLEDAMKAFGDIHPAVARVMDQRGELLLSHNDFDHAAAWFSEARQMRETFYGPEHALVAPSLEKQALLELAAGREVEAAELLKKCLLMQEERYGADDERVSKTLEKLRRFENPNGRPVPPDEDSEEADIRRVLREATQNAQSDGGREAALLHGRLARHLAGGNPSDAEKAYEEWQKWLEMDIEGRKVGSDMELAECIGEYIDLLELQEKDIEDPLRELLYVDKRIFGRDSPELANDMERFGRYLVMKQKYGEAEQMLKNALNIKERHNGSSHPELAGILRFIGRVLFEVNSLLDAGNYFRRALEIDQRSGTQTDEVEDLRSLGMVFCRRGLYEDAEKMYRKVVEIDRFLKGGEEHPNVITENNVLAVLLYAQGKLDQAEPLLNKVLRLREKVLGDDHVDVAESLINLAVLNNRKGNHAAALPMLQRALDILQNAYGDLNSETVACMSWIAETHQKRGDFEDAEGILDQVVMLNRQILGNGHPGVADSLSDLGELCRAQGKLDEAEAHHAEALQIREQHFGDDHEAVAQSAQFLSLLLQSAGREDEAQAYARRVIMVRERLAVNGHRRHSVRAAASQEHVSKAGLIGNHTRLMPSLLKGENARRNHAKFAVEKSLSHLMH